MHATEPAMSRAAASGELPSWTHGHATTAAARHVAAATRLALPTASFCTASLNDDISEMCRQRLAVISPHR